jgi:hypothetical protein
MVVVAMDRTWCEADRLFARDRIAHPFPFWIYDGSPLAYAARILTIDRISLSTRKLKILLGWSRPRARVDGYDNFELGRMWRVDEAWERLRSEGQMEWFTAADVPTMNSFAALDALDALIGGLPPEVRVVLLFTPYFSGVLPAQGTSTAQRLERCKVRVERLAAIRTVGYLDFLQDNAMTREAANFWDPTHYRIHIGRAMENEIAALLGK